MQMILPSRCSVASWLLLCWHFKSDWKSCDQRNVLLFINYRFNLCGAANTAICFVARIRSFIGDTRFHFSLGLNILMAISVIEQIFIAHQINLHFFFLKTINRFRFAWFHTVPRRMVSAMDGNLRKVCRKRLVDEK